MAKAASKSHLKAAPSKGPSEARTIRALPPMGPPGGMAGPGGVMGPGGLPPGMPMGGPPPGAPPMMGGPGAPPGGPPGGPPGMAKGGKWIAGAIKHPGALHKTLGVPQGEKIPAKKLAKAEHSSNPTTAKRARLAQTLKKMHRA